MQECPARAPISDPFTNGICLKAPVVVDLTDDKIGQLYMGMIDSKISELEPVHRDVLSKALSSQNLWIRFCIESICTFSF